MKVATSFQMGQIDRRATSEFGIPSLILMENAGIKAAGIIQELFPDLGGKDICIFCGSGNNGGDGLVVARHLFNQGLNVKIFLLSPKARLKEDARINFEIASKLGIPLLELKESGLKEAEDEILTCELIIDAILGTGVKGPVTGFYAEVIELLNMLGSDIVSIDVPSGLNVDTGFAEEACIYADHTITFGLPKRGLILYPGAEWTGNLTVVNIGFPIQLLTDGDIKVNLLIDEVTLPLLPSRFFSAHKGSFGKVVSIAGSRGMTGAAALVASSTLAIGAGLSILGIPLSLNPILEAKLTEVITVPLKETDEGTLSLACFDQIIQLLENSSVLALGCGLGQNQDVSELVKRLIKEVKIPIVLDADGINAIIDDPSVLLSAKSDVLITPHPGEMARLMTMSVDKVQQDRLGIASKVASEFNVGVVLKGARTVIADPEGNLFINYTGNPGMATAGSGDVLTGMIAGLIAQKLTYIEAAKLGVYLHGLSGDLVVEQKEGMCLVASDLIRYIPVAIKRLKEGK